jgi:PAS domain S-box-containing protein
MYQVFLRGAMASLPAPPSRLHRLAAWGSRLWARRAPGRKPQQGERRSRQIFNAVNDAIFIQDLATGAILDVNNTMLRVYGYTREEALSLDTQALSEGVPPYSQAEARAWIARAAAGEPQVFDWRAKNRQGELFWVEVNMRRAVIDGVDRLLVVTRDIQNRRAAEDALRERDELFRLLFERSGDANLLIEGGLFRDCNAVTLGLVGARTKDEVLDRHPSELSPELQPDGRRSRDKADEIIARALQEGSQRFEWTHRRLDGTLFPVEVMLTAIPWLGKPILHVTWRDLTEWRAAEERRLSLEAQVQQAQKLESLGVLAGGIAHDFNNLLTAVLGNLNLAQGALGEAGVAGPYLDSAEAAVLKAASLTQQMLAYSGKGRFVVKRHDLNGLIREMTHLLQVSLPKKAVLRLDLAESLAPFEADGAQFQQVIMNLVTNAADALEDQEGSIVITSGAEVLDARSIAAAFPTQNLVPGPFLTLEVADSGCGMPPAVLSRIFDPFYTTKASGRGLGLSAMQGILRGHHAGLRIHSSPGAGSRFKVYFPAAPGAAHLEPEPAALREGRFQGTVLLVDDEPSIRETLTAALEDMGFQVLAARDGMEALERFTEAPGAIDLVFMDLTMPRMDGREAFVAMRRVAPELRVILTSGYNELESVRDFIGQGLAGFIQKPYTLKALRKVIQESLELPV